MTLPKRYNGDKWSQARFNSFVKSALRSASLRWEPRYTVLAEAFTVQKTNVKTGRLAKHFLCARCENDFPQKEVEVNHIVPVVPETGFTTWDDIISRLFCEKSGLEVLCKECHKAFGAETKLKKKQQNDTKD